jgi:hypothetical protein
MERASAAGEGDVDSRHLLSRDQARVGGGSEGSGARGARGGGAGVAVGVAAGLMLVAVLENTVAPWAPFYVVYAALATGLPLLLTLARIARETTAAG